MSMRDVMNHKRKVREALAYLAEENGWEVVRTYVERDGRVRKIYRI